MRQGDQKMKTVALGILAAPTPNRLPVLIPAGSMVEIVNPEWTLVAYHSREPVLCCCAATHRRTLPKRTHDWQPCPDCV